MQPTPNSMSQQSGLYFPASVIFCYLTGPASLSAERLKQAMEAAQRELAEEAASRPCASQPRGHLQEAGPSRSISGRDGAAQPYVPDGDAPTLPYIPTPLGSEARPLDVECIRRDFPAISHWSEEMLRSQPVGDLAKANAELEYKLGRSGRPTLEMQLDNNFQQLLSSTSTVKTGEDNQINILHPARFLPGMLCAATDAWLQARDVTPKSGLIPYGQYDVQNLGFSRNLSAKAWAAVHNPGHGNLSIKLFATAASQAASSREQKEAEPFGDLEDFKTALRAASLAQTMVMPWNFSIAAIEGFLHSTKYGITSGSSPPSWTSASPRTAGGGTLENHSW